MIENTLALLLNMPGMMLIIGALAVPLLPSSIRHGYMLAVIAVSGWSVWQMPPDTAMTATLAGIDLILVRGEAITKPFALVFHIAAALNVIYAMHENAKITATAGLAYAGAAIAALFAGDFLTLFIYWELTTFASVFLVLAGNTPRATRAAMRYLLMQVASGVILLAGAIMLWRAGAGFAITALDATTPAGFCILLAFGIKAGFPLLGGWLQDAYPEASPTGSVMLSAFTTKLAIYILVICFAGFKPLIYIGLAMAIISLFAALLENNLRRVLAIALVNQLGIMVVGIGIGTELALNGVVAHAFASVLYKGLLFMSIGAVFMRTGTDQARALGGLARHMPWTAGFSLIGALSIASMPLFSGFTTKALTIGAVAKQGELLVWLGLLFASVGVVLHTALKIPYAIFFAPNPKITADEAPLNMRVAMALAAGLCLVIGLYPGVLYALLPYEVTYKVWDSGHVLGELQLLAFVALAFTLMVRRGIYPLHADRTIIYTDWLTRRAMPLMVMALGTPMMKIWNSVKERFIQLMLRAIRTSEEASRATGLASGVASTGAAAGIFLAVFALILFIRVFM
ncbi:MAG: Na(+)/H(+) antiporter subunit D [Alphaproteobacteria bacterium]|nr:Na(+)/H(+) antiporter subunit D [Alphaproteobacteria bacterium]